RGRTLDVSPALLRGAARRPHGAAVAVPRSGADDGRDRDARVRRGRQGPEAPQARLTRYHRGVGRAWIAAALAVVATACGSTTGDAWITAAPRAPVGPAAIAAAPAPPVRPPPPFEV